MNEVNHIIKVVNNSKHALPSYATLGSAGMDLKANIAEPVTIAPLARVLIPTGLHIELPKGYEAQIRPRSGLALRHGLTVLNSPGTVDFGYTGEIGVILVNLSNEPYQVQDGERVAQMVIAKVEHFPLLPVETLSETERGAGGFGHSGKM